MYPTQGATYIQKYKTQNNVLTPSLPPTRPTTQPPNPPPSIPHLSQDKNPLPDPWLRSCHLPLPLYTTTFFGHPVPPKSVISYAATPSPHPRPLLAICLSTPWPRTSCTSASYPSQPSAIGQYLISLSGAVCINEPASSPSIQPTLDPTQPASIFRSKWTPKKPIYCVLSFGAAETLNILLNLTYLDTNAYNRTAHNRSWNWNLYTKHQKL